MPTPPTVTPEALRRFDPVGKLSPDQLDELAAQTPIERCSAGTVVFKEGEPPKHAVFLLSGDIELSAHGIPSQIISANSPDALRPLGGGGPRTHTATCASAGEIIRIEADLLDAMIAWGQLATPEPEVVMSGDGIFTIDKGSWIKKMIKSPTFRNLPPANVEQLLDKLEPIRVFAGQVIIRQGDPGDYFYMIDQGNAMVTRQAGDEEDESIEMAELKEGFSFGEAALISDKPRNATVSMMSEGVLLRLSKSDFLTLLNEPNVRWIEYPEAQKIANSNGLWLDIRLTSEFAQGHLPNSLNIPVQQLHRRALTLDKAKIYLCYCDNGKRSAAASFIMKQHGLTAWVLRNGIQSLPTIALEK